MKDPADTRAVDAFSDQYQRQFADIPNQRPSTAEQKAQLCLTLKQLCDKPPHAVVNGGISTVRAWNAASEECRKVCAKVSSSVSQLEAAINRMKAFK